MLRFRWHYGWGIALSALLLIAIQGSLSAAGKTFYLTQLTMSAYYSMVVLGLCFLMGHAGQVSLGHAAFFAIGGYSTAVLTTLDVTGAFSGTWGALLEKAGMLAARQDLYGQEMLTFSPGFAFLAGLFIAFWAALLIGYPALRLKGHYLAMATLGFGLIIYRILIGSAFSGSADGISSVPPWELAWGLVISGKKAVRVQNYYMAWGAALVVFTLRLNLMRSRMGRAWKSIHGAEMAANAMGVNTSAYKLRAFVLSALIASAAGSLMTHFNGGIGPSEADAMKSVRYVALVAAGGMTSLWGALFVSALLNFLSLRGVFGSFDHAVFGALLILIISVSPSGTLKKWLGMILPAGWKRKPPAT